MSASSSHPPLLLVDGYNIIGTWSCLQNIRDRQGLQSARQELIEALINYTAHQGFKTQVVFDSQYQKTPSSEEDYTPHLSVYFTAWAQTADTYIEKVCASFSRQVAPTSARIIVATSDRAQRLMIQGYGAEWMSAQRLATELDCSTNQITCQGKKQKRSQSRFLFHALDSKAQERLSQWRQGI